MSGSTRVVSVSRTGPIGRLARVLLAARRRFQVGTLAAGVAAVVVAALIGVLTRGAAWGFPLADLVWWFDVQVCKRQQLGLSPRRRKGVPHSLRRERHVDVPDAQV